MDMQTKLQEIDRRALNLGHTLSFTFMQAGVSSATLAKWRKGQRVTPRSVSKVEQWLDAVEKGREA